MMTVETLTFETLTFETLLAQYQKIDAITKQMLVMANNNEWDDLLNLQTEYDSIVQFLSEPRIPDRINQLTPRQQSTLKSQITEILHNQNQLEKRVDLQRVAIGELIGDKVNLRAKINSYNKMAELV